jgi:transposase
LKQKVEVRYSDRFKRKILARWRVLSAQGVELERAALEMGISAATLAAWVERSEQPLLVPVAISDEREEDPLSGGLYLFTGRRRTTAKVLHFDGTGMCVYQKRLARGRFASLWVDAAEARLELSRAELELFLQGCQLIGQIDLAPRPLEKKDLAISVR